MSPLPRIATLLFVLLLLPRVAPCQSPNPSDTILRPGDVLSIVLIDDPSITTPAEGLTIPPDGSIAFYNIRVMAAGRTTAQVQADLIRGISESSIRNPTLTVNLLKSPYRVISVDGAVSKPGEFPYRDDLTALRAISLAGGLTDRAGREAVLIRRKPGSEPESFRIDLRALYTGDSAANRRLEPGDYLQVSEGVVFVSGAVEKPGEFPVFDEMTVLRALSLSGGLKEMAGKQATLIRAVDGSQTVIKIDLEKLMAGDIAENYRLVPGDYLQVSEGVVYVDGRVKTPGPVSYRVADTVAKAIAAVGGLSTDPDLQNSFIRRDRETIQLDLRSQVGDRADRTVPPMPLLPGDILTIPGLTQKVTILGDVNNAGIVYLVPREQDTLLDALARSGGVTRTADLSRVLLRRSMYDGSEVAMELNMGPKGSISDNVILQHGDVIYIPAKRERDRTQSLFAVSVVTQILSVLRSL